MLGVLVGIGVLGVLLLGSKKQRRAPPAAEAELTYRPIPAFEQARARGEVPRIPVEEIQAAAEFSVAGSEHRRSGKMLRPGTWEEHGELKQSAGPVMVNAALGAARRYASELGGWVAWETRAGALDVGAYRGEVGAEYVAEFDRLYRNLAPPHVPDARDHYEAQYQAILGALSALRERASMTVYS